MSSPPLMAVHPLGTAGASADPARGVLDADLQVRGTPGLSVADGAAVPTSLATRLARHIACRS
jgi:choline dehydrogenase-like flavoprotein